MQRKVTPSRTLQTALLTVALVFLGWLCVLAARPATADRLLTASPTPERRISTGLVRTYSQLYWVTIWVVRVVRQARQPTHRRNAVSAA